MTSELIRLLLADFTANLMKRIKVLEFLNSNIEPIHTKYIAEKLNMKSHTIGQQLNNYRSQGLVIRKRKNLGPQE